MAGYDRVLAGLSHREKSPRNSPPAMSDASGNLSPIKWGSSNSNCRTEVDGEREQAGSPRVPARFSRTRSGRVSTSRPPCL